MLGGPLSEVAGGEAGLLFEALGEVEGIVADFGCDLFY